VTRSATTARRAATGVPKVADGTGEHGAQGVDTLYYDGQCPLCAAEIDQLQRIRGEHLRLVDIHTLDGETACGDARCGEGVAAAAPDGAAPDRDSLLRTLHLQRADGRWLRGADANVAAWDGTGRGRVLRVLRWPLLRHVVDLAYALWARWRYRRLYGKGPARRLRGNEERRAAAQR
jgi:predicted DCC family thiol-disulfide oxidoreductase YuxK